MTHSERAQPVSDRQEMIGPSLRTLVGRIRAEVKNRQKRWTVALVGDWSGHVGPALDFVRFRTMEEAQAWIEQTERNLTVPDLTHYIPVHIDTHREGIIGE